VKHSAGQAVTLGAALTASAHAIIYKRLNFEFDVECYNAELGRELEALIENKRAAAHRVTLEEVDGRPWPIRLRDGVARLFVPYL
jgi:cardiolipin synthase